VVPGGVVYDFLAAIAGYSRVLRLVGCILGLIRYLEVARLLVKTGVASDLVRESLSKLERTDDRN
jgi:hypothetical protein